MTALAFSRDGSNLAVASGTPAIFRRGAHLLLPAQRRADQQAGGRHRRPQGRHPRPGLQPRRQHAGDLRLRPAHQAVGRQHRQGAAHPQGPQRLRLLRGLQSRRQAARLRRRPTGPSRSGTWRTGTRLYTLGESTDWVYAVAWHPDGKHLAAAGVDRSIRVWEASASGGKVVQSVFAHAGPVTDWPTMPTDHALFAERGPHRQGVGHGEDGRTHRLSQAARHAAGPGRARRRQAARPRPLRRGVVLFDEATGKVQSAAAAGKPKSPRPKKEPPAGPAAVPPTPSPGSMKPSRTTRRRPGRR